MTNGCEILAPVGSFDMLVSAVRCGADAVYMGFKEFSARQNAENFGIDELKNAIDYCHIRGVKVYLTLNILIKENELAAAFDLARDAYNFGIDGIIIEDLGLGKLLHEKIPQLKLHASTQMSVHTPAVLPILKEMGFTRVVVAREMSKFELADFCKKAREYDIEVEAFVHGALCMCLSGQCRLSAFLGGRSGNRGLCAGPCRLPFKAEGSAGYDLSLKDLSLLDRLSDLKKLGITSFKIEGRMKRPEYVAAAVTCAKQSLENGCIDSKIFETLKNVFSRQGFTDGYFENNLKSEMFGIRTKDDVLSANKTFPILHELYRGERKSVPISVKAEISADKPITITVSDGENNVTVTGDVPQKANNKAIAFDDVLKGLTKFGGTPYFENGSSITVDDNLFVSASALNELRRTAAKKLDALRAELNGDVSNAHYDKRAFIGLDKKPKVVCRFSSVSQIPDDLTDAEGIIYPIWCNPDFAPVHPNLIVEIPRGIFNEKKIEELLELFKERGFKCAMCGNLSAVELAKNKGFIPLADTGLNIFNSESAQKLNELGCKAATLSCELSLEECKFNANIPKGVISYGNVPLMTFKNCPLKNTRSCDKCDKRGSLTDRLGVEFPVTCNFGHRGVGYSELLNSVPIWLADRQPALLGLDYQVLYFTHETKAQICEVISAYKNEKTANIKFTRGLYFKGVL